MKKAEYILHPLGTVGKPYPTSSVDNKGTNIIGVIEDDENPLLVPSLVEYPRFLGLAYREMPTPTMLGHFFTALVQRSPSEQRKVQFLLGAAGAGKSHLMNLVARMRDPRGAIICDCGGKNLEELLYETVLDIESAKPLCLMIDQLLTSGNINPLSIKVLKDCLGDAFSQQDGKTAIDWNAVIADPKLNVIENLKKVIDIEGIDKKHASSLGIKTRPGPLINAWREGREIILDEYNKCKPGTDSKLHQLWQLFIGEINSHEVHGGSGQSFTFRREEMSPGFFVTLTGNAAKDGMTTYELAASAYDRLRPSFVDEPNIEDYQHRIEQILVGMPVTSLYNISKAQWQDNYNGFSEFLTMILTLGMSEEEISNVPDYQFSFLNSSKCVMQATKILAEFYYKWSQYLDPHSSLFQSEKFADIIMEVDEHYQKSVSVGLRMVIYHLNKAVTVTPPILNNNQEHRFDLSQSWHKSSFNQEMGNYERIEKNFGTRLYNIIMEDIKRTTIGKPKLLAHLIKLAESHLATVRDFLNVDIYQSSEPTHVSRIVRSELINHLKRKFPQQKWSNNPNEIIDLKTLEIIITNLSLSKTTVNKAITQLFIPNINLLTYKKEPLTTSHASYFTIDTTSSNRYLIPSDQLVNYDTVLTALSLPLLKVKNFEALFNKSISESLPVESSDEAIRINENNSQTHLAFTTIATSNNSEYCIMHVIWNNFLNRALIVGNVPIKPELYKSLKRADVTYVNCSNDNAKSLVKKYINFVCNHSDIQNVRNAFILRNGNKQDLPRLEKLSLEELLTDVSITALAPNCITSFNTSSQFKRFATSEDEKCILS